MEPEIGLGLGHIELILDNLLSRNPLGDIQAEVNQRPYLREMLLKVTGKGVPDVPIPPPSTLSPFHVSNGQLFKDGKLFKAMGMNFRELPFYGLGLSPIQWATDSHLHEQLNGAVEYGAKIIRVYCAHPAIPLQQAIPRVQRVLDEAGKRGLYVILCLTDGAPAGEFYVPETPDLKSGRYSWKWILGGYKTGNYRDYVEGMTSALGQHAAIFAWEPINELTALDWPLSDEKANGMLQFWKDITALIRKNSPKKLISNGNVSSWELFVERAYGGGQYAFRMATETELNLICFHSYADSPDALGSTGQHIRNEVDLLKANHINDVAFILGETAGKWTDDYVETDSDPLRKLIEGVFSMGFSVVLYWAVSFPYGKDIGVHAQGYPNWNQQPLSTRWFNAMGLFRAKAKQFQELFS